MLQTGQVEPLWQALDERTRERPRFDVANVAYYIGALIVIGAMGWFMTEAWEALGGMALTGIAVVYATIFIVVGRIFWDRHSLRVPGGLLLTMAVGMMPLATYGLLRQFDLWPQGEPGAYRGFHIWIKGSWITVELATVLAGVLMLRWRRFAFITAPIAVALWYLSMDLAPLLVGVPDFDWEVRRWVSLFFGLVMLVVAYAIDLRGRGEDFAFWIYLFGLLAFWGGLSTMNSGSEWGKFCYFLINVGLIAVSLLLRRPMFTVFGALGMSGYIGYLSFEHFNDSILFPFALTIVGIAVIALGVIYQRNRVSLERTLLSRLPSGWQVWLPPRVRSEESPIALK